MRVVMRVIEVMDAAAYVMVMALLRRPDGILVADDAGAVFAQLAVHSWLAPSRSLTGEFGDAVEEGVDHPVVVPQMGRLDELDVGKTRSHRVGLRIDALHKDAG